MGMRELKLRTEVRRPLDHEEIDENFRHLQRQINRLNATVFGEDVPHLPDTHQPHDELRRGDEGPVHEPPSREPAQGRSPFNLPWGDDEDQ